jgi:hypothetical protein
MRVKEGWRERWQSGQSGRGHWSSAVSERGRVGWQLGSKETGVWLFSGMGWGGRGCEAMTEENSRVGVGAREREGCSAVQRGAAQCVVQP